MFKDHFIGAKITGLDFEYIKREAKKRKITKSHFLRKIIRWFRKRKCNQK